jgi:carboxyl-terminal processing protease
MKYLFRSDLVMSKRTIALLAVLWIVIITSLVSYTLAMSRAEVAFNEYGARFTEEGVLVTQEQYDRIERFERLQFVLDIVNNNYYISADEDSLLTGAVRGLLNSLGDPYTFYYTPEEMSSRNDHSAGTYEGVGIQLIEGKSGELIITRAFKNGSALEMGIRAGDIIIAVDGQLVNADTTLSMNEAIALIKGDPGGYVEITVSRDGEILPFKVQRRTVTIDRVEYKMLENDIGYIALYEFMGDDVAGFENALTALNAARGLIIDLRSNPGGYLDDVLKIADMILPEGLIVYTEDRAGIRENHYSDPAALNKPLAVLVNGMSASASEILAGAIQDYKVGTIVGEKTFGKGVVQTLIPFRSDGAGVQLTTSTYFTPKGRSINKVGIEPDVYVKSDPGADPAVSGLSPESDPQLRMAIDILISELSED